jgi:hypothetical protein
MFAFIALLIKALDPTRKLFLVAWAFHRPAPQVDDQIWEPPTLLVLVPFRSWTWGKTSVVMGCQPFAFDPIASEQPALHPLAFDLSHVGLVMLAARLERIQTRWVMRQWQCKPSRSLCFNASSILIKLPLIVGNLWLIRKPQFELKNMVRQPTGSTLRKSCFSKILDNLFLTTAPLEKQI